VELVKEYSKLEDKVSLSESRVVFDEMAPVYQAVESTNSTHEHSHYTARDAGA